MRPPAALGPATIVWMLGTSQIIGYGTLYYSFATLAPDIAETFAWPLPWIYGSFSVALLVGGLAAPVVGQRIDRHGGGAVMAVGSALAAVALLLAALSPSPILFTASIVGVQAAAGLVLYDAAFAVLVQIMGTGARQRITQLTLIAGFASTIFWPLTSWLGTALTWGEILFAFAGLNLFVCLPIHVLLAMQHRRLSAAAIAASATAAERALARGPLGGADRPVGHDASRQRRLLWLVTAGFALSGFSLAAVLAQMVPLLTSLGLGTSALAVSTLFGPAQVLVRFLNMLVGLRLHPVGAALLALALLPLALAFLLATSPLMAGGIVFVVLLGFGSGLKSVVQGTLPLALFGSAAYGARLGWMASARQAMAAASPFALSWLGASIGPVRALGVLAAVAGLGLACLVAVARLHRAEASKLRPALAV